MNKIRIIDLLNKIANGEEVPKHIHIRDLDKYTWQDDVKAYWSDRDENDLLSDLDLSSTDLNEDIGIVENKFEEEKKIPEKLDLILDEQFTNDELQAYIYETQVKVNQVIDYLKSKGE